MKWNLRLTAAQREIWTASDLQRRLAAHGLVISAGKMSGLWSGNPQSIKLSDLDILCTVLNASPADLLIPEPVAAVAPAGTDRAAQTATGETVPPSLASGTPRAAAPAPSVRPRRRSNRSLPPPV